MVSNGDETKQAIMSNEAFLDMTVLIYTVLTPRVSGQLVDKFQSLGPHPTRKRFPAII
jgi:hypothetical protein